MQFYHFLSLCQSLAGAKLDESGDLEERGQVLHSPESLSSVISVETSQEETIHHPHFASLKTPDEQFL